MSAWHDFLLAGAGAAAAIAGLLIVAVSVNVEAVLDSPGVPARAAATLSTVGVCLATTLTALVPGAPPALLAALVALYALGAGVLHVRALRAGFPHMPRGAARKLIRLLDGPGPVLPFLAGAAFLIPLPGTGLAWIAAGTILALLATLENGWILLVEILR